MVALATRFYWERILASGVNILTKSLKVSYTTQNDFFEVIFFQNSQKIWQKYCVADLTSLSDRLTCWLSISVLVRGFFGIKVTPLFAVYNFRNKELLRFIFFLKYSIFHVYSGNAEKIKKIFFDLEIIAFELVPLNTRFYRERILLMGSQSVHKESQDFQYY